MRRSWVIFSSILFFLTLSLGSVFGDRLLSLSREARSDLKTYTNLLEVAKEHYAGEATHKSLVYASIDGMIKDLDPHTNFLPPEAYTQMQERQQSSFFGLGILVGIRNAQLTVIAPLDGTPASRRGLQAGDVIDAINGDPTEDMTLDEAIGQLKGPKGTDVNITILREGHDRPLEFTITRDEIPQTTVRYTYMLDDQTGYFRISDFRRSTGKEVSDAIESLKEQGMKKLILDLRNNGGGLLDQAIEVADQFVPRQGRIVETRGRVRDSNVVYDAAGKHPPFELPLVVLVNSGSASASEILAGAIQDHDLGIIVGTTTWGKGLVQTVYNLSYGAAIALTTARYYTPSGRLIQRDYSSVYDYYSHSDALEGDEFQPEPGTEIFQTDLGRDVFGGGGITPDVKVEFEPSPKMIQFLRARSAFFNFSVHWASEHEIADQSWRPDAKVLDSFKEWLLEEDIGEPSEIEESFTDETIREEAERHIRAEIFNSKFSNEAWYSVLAESDNQIRAGLKELDTAAALLARRINEGSEAEVAR